MRLAEIKIKIKSLAAEIAMIHADERKYERRWRQARARLRAMDGEHLSHRAVRQALNDLPIRGARTSNELDMTAARELLLKDVQAGLMGTREQNTENLDRNGRDHGSLREHRDGLRQEYRSSLLAYAYLRGRPYAACEVAHTRSHPDWQRIWDIAVRFGASTGGMGLSAFGVWKRAGQRHLGLTAPEPAPLPERPAAPPPPAADERTGGMSTLMGWTRNIMGGKG